MTGVDDAIQAAQQRAEKPQQEKPDAAYIDRWRQYWMRQGYDDADKNAFAMLAGWCAYYRRELARRGLLMTGENGTGKTFAAQIVAKSFRGRYRTSREIVARYEDAGPEAMRDYLTPIGSEYASGLMVIDELGDEPVLNRYGTKCEVMAEVLCDLYERWKRHGGVTIITTNLNPAAIQARYGGRVTSRLAEMTTTIAFQGADRRLEQ